VRAVPLFCKLYPGICLTTEEKARKPSVSVATRTSQADTVQYIFLTTEEKARKPSVKVAARTSQADTVQYKNNEQYNTQKKNSNTQQYNVTEQ
jgi:hypothetical protein